MANGASPSAPQIRPGDTIGILGGGQLGRMLALAAARLGLSVHILSPEEHPPAALVSARHIRADYEDELALRALAQSTQVVTFEWENVPLRSVELLEALVPVRPGSKALRVAQDRLEEKRFLTGLGIAVAPFANISCADDMGAVERSPGFPLILKTRRMGYDGKGQVRVERADALLPAWERLGRVPCCAEAVVAFEGEASLILARAVDGATQAYSLIENEHRNHILAESRVPARWDSALANAGADAARKIAQAFDYVGVLAVEFFVKDGSLIANEIAPRVHNSGHWTIEGARTSQFENHIRAVCGWPLGATESLGRVRMVNLIGADADRWKDFLSMPGAQIHLYGKSEARPARKMGHVTWVDPEPGGRQRRLKSP